MKPKYPTPQETFDKFWKSFCENPDGTLNREQIMKELSDFSMLIDHITKLYDLASGGRISYPTTLPEEVYAEFQRQLDERYQEGYNDGFTDAGGEEDETA